MERVRRRSHDNVIAESNESNFAVNIARRSEHPSKTPSTLPKASRKQMSQEIKKDWKSLSYFLKKRLT